ncbi:gas vesicle protein [Planctomycetaceae bacterium SH139]
MSNTKAVPTDSLDANGNLTSGGNSLCDALDRLLTTGVAAEGEITISVAGVDLLFVGLKGLLCAIDAIADQQAAEKSSAESSQHAAPSPPSQE